MMDGECGARMLGRPIRSGRRGASTSGGWIAEGVEVAKHVFDRFIGCSSDDVRKFREHLDSSSRIEADYLEVP
jgi:hypothetical protein